MKLVSIFLLVFFSYIIGYAQDATPEDRTVNITTTDGSKIKGTILSQDDKTITIETAYGQSTISKKDIESLEYLESEGSQANKDEYSGSHYLLDQTAFGLKKGQSYYENTYLFLNTYAVGITDNFSVSVGAELANVLFGGQLPGILLTPKLSFPFKKGAFSLSTSLLSIPDYDGGYQSGGILQAKVSFGSLQNNFTVGIGRFYTISDGFEEDASPISIGGIKRLSEKVSILSENWIAINDSYVGGVLSFGLRFHSKSNNNFLTLSLLRPTEDTDPLIAIPFFSGTISLK